jgi:SAM-dependent methyltransferase
MKEEELQRLYDDRYAAEYEEKFLTSDLARADAQHELKLLAGWLETGGRWLDVACGTGFFLSRFPRIERAGLDLSHAMLERAKKANPGVELREGSFLEAIPEWKDRWDLVSCMWYAYGLVSSMEEVERLIGNLAAWTAPRGRCFLPVADPRLITGVDLPYRCSGPWPGEVAVSGILWSYAEEGGAKVHAHQIAPHVEYLQELLARYFETVEREIYPPAFPDWEGRRSALVATGKKSV